MTRRDALRRVAVPVLGALAAPMLNLGRVRLFASQSPYSVRAVTLMGVRLALIGVVIPAAAILAITLTAAVYPRLQGILLTALALGFFIVAMMLFPRLHFSTGPAVPAGETPAPVPPEGSGQ